MGKIIRAMSSDGSLSVFAAATTDIVNEAISIHNLYPVSAAALGRTLTAAALMGSMMKNKTDTVTLRITSSGSIKKIIAVSDYYGNVRGLIDNPGASLPLNGAGKLDVSQAVGAGILSVVRDTGSGQPFVGQIELVSGEIAEDITQYFYQSEQIGTICALGVLIGEDNSALSAGGMLVQMLPGADESYIPILEANAAAMPSVSEILRRGTPADIIGHIMKSIEYNLFDETEIDYLCGCSRERMSSALAALGKDELRILAEEDGGAELCCHFCNTKYKFDGEFIYSLLDS